MLSKNIIPHGDVLRQLLSKGSISKGEIATLLKQRGVYLDSYDKEKTIPILMKSLLGPSDFLYLIEVYKEREESSKFSTEVYACADAEALEGLNLYEFSVNEFFDEEYKNYTLVGALDIGNIEEDEKHFKIAFRIKKQDLTKDWGVTDSYHDGSIEVKIDDDNVRILQNYTNSETKEVCGYVKDKILVDLKLAGVINNKAKHMRVMFRLFDNNERRNFFMALTVNLSSSKINFTQINDFKFYPVEIENLKGTDLAWVGDSLKAIALSGSSLEKVNILNDSNIYSNIYLNSLEVFYYFSFDSYQGECRVSLNFPQINSESTPDDDSIFEMSVKNIKFNKDIHGSKAYVTELILKELERHKDRFLLEFMGQDDTK